MEIITHTARQTQQLARRIARQAVVGKPPIRAVVIGLTGELGSGKTTFVQGFAQVLGITARILSPTFTIIRQYLMQNKRFETLYHLDLYRIDETSLGSLGIDEIVSNNKNIVLVEWIEKAPKLLQQVAIHITFHQQSNTIRTIRIDTH